MEIPRWTRRLRSLLGRPSDPEEAHRRRLFKAIGYRFRNARLADQALTHRSHLTVVGRPRIDSNERLELLGDAVLGLLVTEHLYERFPEKEEGELTMIKSLIVSRRVLAQSARRLNLGQYLSLSESEERAGGRDRPSIITDALEALIGGIYLDGGLPAARAFVHRHLLRDLDDLLAREEHRNYKSLLLEHAQASNLGHPVYTVRSEEGPDHDKRFTIEVRLGGQVLGVGIGSTKKRAEQRAAASALKKIIESHRLPLEATGPDTLVPPKGENGHAS